MNLRQLDLFVAVAETRSFSRGAQAIGLTQSTVSQHIAALEEEVGTKLFDRTQQGALLTAGGQLFLRHARRVLAERDQLFQGMAAFNGVAEGVLQIGASNIPATCLVPQILSRLAETYPAISIHMRSGDSREMLEKLLAAEVELALVGSAPEQRQLEALALASDLLVLIVGPRHRWCQRGEIELAELAQERLVTRESGSGSEQALLRELQRHDFPIDRLQVAARLGNNEAVRQVVAGGFGCAFVSERSVQRELAAGELCRVAVRDFRVERHFWLARLRGRTPSPAAAAVTELLLQSYQPGASF